VTLFYPTTHITLLLDSCAWRQATHYLPLFEIPFTPCSCMWVLCIALNITLLLSVFEEGARKYFPSSRRHTSHLKTCCSFTSKLSQWNWRHHILSAAFQIVFSVDVVKVCSILQYVPQLKIATGDQGGHKLCLLTFWHQSFIFNSNKSPT
jgi:hypothetical protein